MNESIQHYEQMRDRFTLRTKEDDDSYEEEEGDEDYDKEYEND